MRGPEWISDRDLAAVRDRHQHIEQDVLDVDVPKRIQLRRTKGWRKPDGAIVVARPSIYGNPYPIGGRVSTADGKTYGPISAGDCVRAFRLLFEYAGWERYLPLEPLRGHDLACWCPLDQPCHADVLLELANGATP